MWTHAQFKDDDSAVALEWEVATENSFASPVSRGTASATRDNGFTVKVDATGLQAGTDWVYRFRSGAAISADGRTRTLPTGAPASVRLAVFSCANYPAGYFHVYAAAAAIDAQFALHLVDYRARYRQTRSDPDAKTLHARMPMIAVLDDHALAKGDWRDGARQPQRLAQPAQAQRPGSRWPGRRHQSGRGVYGTERVLTRPERSVCRHTFCSGRKHLSRCCRRLALDGCLPTRLSENELHAHAQAGEWPMASGKWVYVSSVKSTSYTTSLGYTATYAAT